MLCPGCQHDDAAKYSCQWPVLPCDCPNFRCQTKPITFPRRSHHHEMWYVAPDGTPIGSVQIDEDGNVHRA